MKNQTNTKLAIRLSLALALAPVIWSPIRAQMTNPGSGGMGGTNGRMGGINGWAGGGIWIWTVVGVLVVVLLVILISKLSSKSS